MSHGKKKVREDFRDAVFGRDRFKCVVCGGRENLDAHHITDRSLMPHGGYVKENGITLCGEHHLQAEAFHETGEAMKGMSPEDLYAKIASSLDEALSAEARVSKVAR